MVCHDVSDVFMETAKLFNYAQKRFRWCHVSAPIGPEEKACGTPSAVLC